MSWSAVLAAFLVSHLVGDFLLQTDWQAVGKSGGLGDPGSRRPLFEHVLVYTIAFVPALVWIGASKSVAIAVASAAAVAMPHLLIDEGHLVKFWIHKVKRVSEPPASLSLAVDQSFHVVCLFGAALIASA